MDSMSLPSAFKEISGAEVQAMLARGSSARLVDVRQPWEHARSHISGILLMPMDEFAARYTGELDPADEIVCVCEHGIRSTAAAHFLAAQGYQNVATMTGGMAEYHGPVKMGTEEDR